MCSEKPFDVYEKACNDELEIVKEIQAICQDAAELSSRITPDGLSGYSQTWVLGELRDCLLKAATEWTSSLYKDKVANLCDKRQRHVLAMLRKKGIGVPVDAQTPKSDNDVPF